MKTGLFFITTALVFCSCASEPQAPHLENAADYQPAGWAAKTLPQLSAALQNNELTSEDLVKAYLSRVETVDNNGPALQSILMVNPDALSLARKLDAERAEGKSRGPLHGIPVVLKDNIETKDRMPTTAGALALKGNLTERDSPLAAGLRAQGAIILGKTNLSQWANFRSERSMSGWSALGGQVRNPHILDRNPCGSSSGSGVAIAASLAAGAVGTETNGSIICPSTINGVVGFKPTVGLVSQKYIIPISSTQDTAGPMTKTVKGAAMLLSAMANADMASDYAANLDPAKLNGARIGVLRFAKGSNPDIHRTFNVAVKDIEAAGGIIVEINDFDMKIKDYGRKSRAVLDFEFKATLNEYLEDAAPGLPVKSLSDLIDFNQEHADIELALFDQSIFKKANEKNGLDYPEYLAARSDIIRATGVDGIDALMSENNVDILVAPSGPIAPRVDPINGDVWPDWAGAGNMAAVSGYPHLTVPMGEIHGLPIGLSFIGGKGEDAKVLSYGYAYEQKTNHLVTPQYLRSADVRQEIAKAMKK